MKFALWVHLRTSKIKTEYCYLKKKTHCFHGIWCCEDNAFFFVCKINFLKRYFRYKKWSKKAVISTQILPRKAVNRIQIFVIKTVSDSFDFAIKDITGALFL